MSRSSEIAAYDRLNALMVERYPQMAYLLADPQKFCAGIRARFGAQKAATPETPHAFDFTDVATPILKSLQKDITAKRDELDTLKKTLQRKLGNVIGQLGWWRKGMIAELEIALAYLADLDAEIATRTGPGGSCTYQRMLQLTAAIAAAFDYRGDADHSPSEKLMLSVDRFLEGHRHVSIAEHYARYKSGDIKLFDAVSPVKGFKEAQPIFTAAVYNVHELELIGLPVTQDIGIDILLRLLPFHVYPLGVTRRPIAADGFVRPALDFLLHDLRHSTAIFAKRKLYEIKHGLTPEASQQLSRAMDVWGAELLDEVTAIANPSLRSAVELLAFNNHHDRGFVLAPSTYMVPKIDRVPRLLYTMLRLSGQPVGFANHHTQLQAAHDWLRAFFEPRYAEETALWPAEQRLLGQSAA